MAGLDDHENRDEQEDTFKDMVEAEEVFRAGVHDGADPFEQQPGGEKIEALEGVKTGGLIAFELAGGEDDDGCNPADRGDVAEDSGCAGRHASQGVRRRSWGEGTGGRASCGGRLARAAVAAKRSGTGDFTTALCAKGHGFM